MRKKIIPVVAMFLLIISFVGFVAYKIVTADHIGSTITVTNSDGTHAQVYVAASSNIYEYWDSTTPAGVFLDIFNDVKQEGETLAGAIDKGFPYSIEFVASTATSDSTRYLIQTPSGSTYWVEP